MWGLTTSVGRFDEHGKNKEEASVQKSQIMARFVSLSEKQACNSRSEAVVFFGSRIKVPLKTPSSPKKKKTKKKRAAELPKLARTAAAG